MVLRQTVMKPLLRRGGTNHCYTDGDKMINIDECGFVSYFDSSLEIADCVLVDKYRRGKDDFDSTVIKFQDGDKKLSVLCDEAKEWYKANFDNSTLDYEIRDAFVVEVENDKGKTSVASLCGEFCYKGIEFNNHYFKSYDENLTTTFKSMSYGTSAQYNDSKQLGSFIINNQTLNVIKATSQDKIISFSNAVEKVATKLSGFGTMEFELVAPMYEITLKGNNYESLYGPGQVFEARPVYVFLCKKEESSVDSICMPVSPFELYDKYCTIDMITGDFNTNLGL